MDAQQFLAEFGHIANAPGGGVQLRNLILHFAATGKLVQQNTMDESAQKLLERIRRHASNGDSKKRRRSSKKTKTRQFLPEDSFPSSWALAELGELGDWGAGSTPSRSNSTYYGGSIPWFKSGELKSDYLTESEEFVSDLALKKCSLRLNVPGDVLIAMYGANIGQTSIVGVESTTNQAVCACTPHEGLNNRFLLLTLRAMKTYFVGLGAGGAQPNISKEKIVATCIGLPPAEEQSRIVTKVDELMTLCDKLEALQQDRRKLQNDLRQSILQAVTRATSPHELQTTWIYLAKNFGRLFHAPEDMAELRHLILDLAAKGSLSEPQIGDGDPSVTLSQISFQQKVELSTRELREVNALPELIYEKRRVRTVLGRIVKLVSGQHLSPEEYNNRQDGIPYITGPAEFKGRRPLPTKWTIERRAVAKAGDILITVKGSGVGKSALCDLDELAISRQLMAIRSLGELNRDYLSVCIDSAERNFQRQKFGIAIPGIGRDEVLRLQILLPSIEEQSRIVKRVKELMRFCDSLELQLRNHQKLAGRFVIAAVSSLTGITTEQEEQTMKIPQTELIAQLRLGTPPDVKEQAPLATMLARYNGEMSAKNLWQRFGGEIDTFYAQLKIEVAHGWIQEPVMAEMREKQPDTVGA